MLDQFLISPGAGISVALIIGLVGVLLIWWGQRGRRRRARWPRYALGGLAILISAVLSVAAVWQWGEAARQARLHPPPGRMVDVGGYRMHILCEGPVDPAKPTIVWIPGTRSPGLMLRPLHDAVKAQNRSCLYDRSGSGWSDVGPLPKTIDLDVRELYRALKGGGEPGPYVIAAHSMGGLLATNFAARHLGDVRGMVLVDTLSAGAFAYGPDINCRQIRTFTQLGALAAQFGLTWASARAAPDQEHRIVHQRLGAATLAAMAANDGLPKASLLVGNVYWSACRHPLAAVVGDGALGDMPLIVIQPGSRGIASRVAEARDHPERLADHRLTSFEIANLDRIYRQMQQTNARLSSRGHLVMGPPGTSHQLPFERPDIVLGAVRTVIAETTDPARHAATVKSEAR